MFTCAYCEEKAVFGENGSQSISYGLTDTEKVLIKSKEEVSKLNSELSSAKIEISTLEEQVDGLRTVLNGLSEQNNDLNRRLLNLENLFGADSNKSNLITDQIRNLSLHVDENQRIQTANNEEVKKIIKELGTLIDSINSNYVSKNELKALKDKLKLMEKNISSSDSKNVSKSVSNKSSKSIFLEAKDLYSANKLDKAKEYFEICVKNKYKPAYSNYMLGEISYQQKSWNNAIAYYAKSVELYDKSRYMPRLLYHTAISFDKIGNTENANKFYKALKTTYPDSKEAKASPDRE